MDISNNRPLAGVRQMTPQTYIAMVASFVISIVFSNLSCAGESHHHNYQAPTDETKISTTINNYIQQGVALSDAFSQIDCTFTSHKWHGGIGLGFNEEYVAPAAGICKRWGETQIKGTFGVEHGQKRGGIGVMFQFE